jgi:diguanylate cyclase (GGDEF)-like protein
MEQFLSQAVNVAKIQNRSLSVSMVDIDHFKAINDKYGHVAGDKILKDLSKLIVKNMRKSDIVIRYGGEEILIAMPKTNAKDACVKMEHIRKIIEEHKFHENIKLTISVGVCEYSGTEVEEFVQKADKLLYMAKKLGRNRVMCQ